MTESAVTLPVVFALRIVTRNLSIVSFARVSASFTQAS